MYSLNSVFDEGNLNNRHTYDVYIVIRLINIYIDKLYC